MTVIGYYGQTGSTTQICDTCSEAAESLAADTCPVPETGNVTGSVEISSGNFLFNLPLLSISSLGGMNWSFGINYLAGFESDGFLGKGFNDTQNLHLEELANLDVDLVTGQNTTETFWEDAGSYDPAPDNNTQADLTRAGTGANDEFTLTSKAGVVTKFYGFDVAVDTPGRLKSITDRYGSQQLYEWTEVATGIFRLTKVTDTYGREINYSYYDSSPYRLKEIEDFLERKLNFQYDDDDRLVAVVTPSILKAADGNTFPGGTAYVFQYDVNNSDADRRDDLIRIWYPNEVEPFLDTSTRTVDVEAVYTVTGLAARWKLNEGSGTVATDDSGNGHNGTIEGATWTIGPTGEAGTALAFTGAVSGEGVDCTDIEMGSYTELTVSAWFKTSNTTKDMRVVSKDQVGVNGCFLLWFEDTSGEWRFSVNGGAGFVTVAYASTAPNDDAWHHIAGVVDDEANLLRLYIDGVQVASTAWTAASLDDSQNEEVVIGADSDTASYDHIFDGDISDVEIYDSALSATEITNLAAQAQTVRTAVPRYTVAYGQDSGDTDTYGRVISETVGNPDGSVGGTYQYDYATTSLPTNIIDPSDPIVFEATLTDRNGNIRKYAFNGADMTVRKLVDRNRDKINIPAHGTGTGQFNEFITWTKYNENNQPVLKIFPEGNSVEYSYDDGMVDLGAGDVLYNKRLGLLNRETRKVDNPLKLDASNAIDALRDAPSNGQTELTRLFFYDPIYQRQTAVIEERGNPVASDYTVWGAQASLGGKSPNGSFFENGTHNSQPAYEHADGTFWLWWDSGASEWHISVVKGTDGSGHWELATVIKGTYTAQGTAAGALDVSAADYFITGTGFDNSNEAYPARQYYEDGTQGGQAAYRTAASDWWLWFDSGNTEWVISAVKGTDGNAHWKNGSATITTGPYASGGTNGAGELSVAANGGSAFFAPQNGGTTPTLALRNRYASVTFFDYQKDAKTTVEGDSTLQSLLALTSTEIGNLITHVSDQMKAVGLTDGGAPASGFEMDLGDINGDGTGSGNSSGLPDAAHVGNTVKVQQPDVRLIGADAITTQTRVEIFTTNDRGQTTTHTDAEGNLTLYVRYPYSDPEGDGRFVAPGLGAKQYGRSREVHVDANPEDVMSLIGSDGDLVDFISGKITRSNTPGVYQDLTTRYEGTTVGSGGGCASCAYDALGNALAETDARGFTTHIDRNELGEAFRTTAPDPYRYKVETYYDANRNVTRVDTEDQWVQYESDDPTSANYAHFVPSGTSFTAQVPTRAGFGGSIRPGWFTDTMTYDLLDNVTQSNSDATGSDPDRLITAYEYDANENVIVTTKPMENTVEVDYDERDMQIAQWVGGDGSTFTTGAISVTAYGGNGNAIQAIGPARRGSTGNEQSVTIEDGFDTGAQLAHTGDFSVSNQIDGFNRAILARDAAGNTAETSHDPGGRSIETKASGPVSGTTPTNRDGDNNEELSRGTMRYDEGGRSYESEQAVFAATGTSLHSTRDVTHTGGGLATNSVADDHTGTVTIISSGSATSNESYVLGRTVYDRAGRSVEVLADNTGQSSTEYDGASRSITSTDAVGNQVDYGYDANSNVVYTKSIETPTFQEPAADAEVFETATRYDSLNRVVARAVANPTGA